MQWVFQGLGFGRGGVLCMLLHKSCVGTPASNLQNNSSKCLQPCHCLSFVDVAGRVAASGNVWIKSQDLCLGKMFLTLLVLS
eukprot:2622150-Amphidinium_carterae.2